MSEPTAAERLREAEMLVANALRETIKPYDLRDTATRVHEALAASPQLAEVMILGLRIMDENDGTILGVIESAVDWPANTDDGSPCQIDGTTPQDVAAAIRAALLRTAKVP